jgi:hypothetical protein
VRSARRVVDCWRTSSTTRRRILEADATAPAHLLFAQDPEHLEVDVRDFAPTDAAALVELVQNQPPMNCSPHGWRILRNATRTGLAVIVVGCWLGAVTCTASAETMPPIETTGDASLIVKLDVENRTFYPLVLDGYYDSTTLRFAPATPSSYHLTIAGGGTTWIDINSKVGLVATRLGWAGGLGAVPPTTGHQKRARPGVYAVTLSLAAINDPARTVTASWTVVIKTRLDTARRATARFSVVPHDVVTHGSCLSTPSSQLAGTRIQCFGGANASAVITLSLDSRDNVISGSTPVPTKVGSVTIHGKGAYASATARISGSQILVRVVVAGRQALDVSSVTVPVTYSVRR